MFRPSRLAELRAAQPFVLAALLLWLLVGPRVELPHAFGLRVEDLVFAALAAICLRHLRLIALTRSMTVAVVAVVATGVLSALVGSLRGMVDPVTAVLFAVRPLEYWIALPAALLLLKTWRRATARIDLLLAVVTVLQTGFAVLQYYFELPIGFSHAAYTRAAGLTVGPYELGAMSAALLVYWVARGRLPLASLAAIALTASISRVSLLGAAAALTLLVAAWVGRTALAARRNGLSAAIVGLQLRPWRVLTSTASVLGAMVVIAFTLGLITPAANPSGTAAAGPSAPASAQAFPSASPNSEPSGAVAPSATSKPGRHHKPEKAKHTPASTSTPTATATAPSGPVVEVPTTSIEQRLKSTSVLGSWIASAPLAAAITPPRTGAGYQETAYARLNEHVPVELAASSGTEASNLVRFFRWHLLLDTFESPLDVVFGLGPSFAGPSVDGSYLRMFTDGGLLGVIAWGALLVCWLRRGPLWMVCVTVSMLVGATFIDILYAERPMVLFWMMLAIAGGSTARAAKHARHRARSSTDAPVSERAEAEPVVALR